MKHFGNVARVRPFVPCATPYADAYPKCYMPKGLNRSSIRNSKQMMLRIVSFNLYSVFCGYLKKYHSPSQKRRVVCFLNRRKTNIIFLDSSCRNYRLSHRDITFLDSSCRNYRLSCRDITFLDSSVGRAHDC